MGTAPGRLEALFESEMARLEAASLKLFGAPPTLAAGLSGGGDSLALTALLSRWIQARGGRLLAITVDHGLRPGSRAEAQAAGRQAEALGAEHRLLTWNGPSGGGGLQKQAREARLALLSGACRAAGIGALFLGHTLEDQAETFLLRLEGRSDLPGLACMAAARGQGGITIVRPLLSVRRAALRSWLQGEGLEWADDPSNLDAGFSRVRLRKQMPWLAKEGVTPSLLAATARDLGSFRARLARAVSERLDAAVTLHPEGYIDATSSLLAPPSEIAGWALTRCLLAVGGHAYPPRREALERLLGALRATDFPGATLASCRIKRRGDGLRLEREAADLPPPRKLEGEESLIWDGRFRLDFSPEARGLELRALGAERPGETGLPAAVLETLPGLFDAKGLAEVPSLAWRRADLTQEACLRSEFAPLNPLKDDGFTVAPPERHIIS